MKQLRYEAPELEIVEFEAEDIITTSPDDNELPMIPTNSEAETALFGQEQ